MTNEAIATRIESARNHLDMAHSHAGSEVSRDAILLADAILKRLKADIGHPQAGLGVGVSPAASSLDDWRREVRDKLDVAITSSRNSSPSYRAIVLQQCEDFLVECEDSLVKEFAAALAAQRQCEADMQSALSVNIDKASRQSARAEAAEARVVQVEQERDKWMIDFGMKCKALAVAEARCGELEHDLHEQDLVLDLMKEQHGPYDSVDRPEDSAGRPDYPGSKRSW